MRCRLLSERHAWLGIGLLIAHAGAAQATASRGAPDRVVSLNPCVDTILVEIAPREQIAALSFRSLDPTHSPIVAIAKTYPITYETAEEVVALNPDLVIATQHSALATRNALRRIGIRTVILAVPESVDGSFEQIRQIAAAVGRQQAGTALIARIQSAIDAARGNTHQTALIFQPSGLTPGKGTLIGELMRIVGFENVADRYGIERWGLLGLEQLVADPPQVLLTGEVAASATTRAERKLQHPALLHLQGNVKRATFPARFLYCGGPVIEHALRALVSARDGSAPQLSARHDECAFFGSGVSAGLCRSAVAESAVSASSCRLAIAERGVSASAHHPANAERGISAGSHRPANVEHGISASSHRPANAERGISASAHCPAVAACSVSANSHRLAIAQRSAGPLECRRLAYR